MKLRLLNASHQGLCYLGRLCGYTYVHEAAQDPLFEGFLRQYMDKEATPTLDPVPGVNLRVHAAPSSLHKVEQPQVGRSPQEDRSELGPVQIRWAVPSLAEMRCAGGSARPVPRVR